MNPGTSHEGTIEIPGKNQVKLAVRGLLAFIQGIFHGVEGYHWSEELESTGILIREGEDMDPSKLEKLPAILVSSGDMSWIQPNSSSVSYRKDEWVGRMHQLSVTLSFLFFGKDKDEVDDLSWMVFLLLPEFMPTLARYSGVSLIGSPMKRPGSTRGSDGRDYAYCMLQARGALMVGVRKRLRPTDGVVDYAYKRARMVFEAEASQPEHRDGVGLVREELPAAELDSVIRRSRLSGIQVLPPDADRTLGRKTTLNRDMEFEEE